ncbi:c-type cytochrome [Pseudomonas sp. S31]|uniref:cytochrome c n=1 Tax=Pseudomonas sp. S31 TaxID=1564473 RepID=UPI001911D83D|nr:cytochrome c [Pseudomonas sp. S31]MBK4997921.1 c-type cytochrome [Pseudomonas sp. S31]
MTKTGSTKARARWRALVWTGLAVAVAVGVGAGSVIWKQSQIDMPIAKPGQDNAALVERGRAVALASDCVACHTSEASKPFAGGMAFDTPFGKLYSTNITQDPVNGIGTFTDAEIVGSVRNGISQHGRRLYPAMPYTSYTGMSDDDALALVAYLRTIEPIDSKPPENTMAFPFNQRWAMAFWNVMNFQAGRQLPVAGKSDEWNRGAYLVQSLEHCGECHTPRNFIQGLSHPNLGGGDLGTWKAYDISSGQSGIGSWSAEELFTYLKTGAVHGKANAAGPMAEAVENSLNHLPDADLHAMVTYLRDLPVSGTPSSAPARTGQGQAYTGTTTLRARHPQYDPDSDALGGEVMFNANCATCHAVTGKGVGEYPRLFGNSVLGAAEPTNLVSVLLRGVHRKVDDQEVFMPGFANLSDAQLATLSTFLFKQFGNSQVQVTAAQVAKLR